MSRQMTAKPSTCDGALLRKSRRTIHQIVPTNEAHVSFTIALGHVQIFKAQW